MWIKTCSKWFALIFLSAAQAFGSGAPIKLGTYSQVASTLDRTLTHFYNRYPSDSIERASHLEIGNTIDLPVFKFFFHSRLLDYLSKKSDQGIQFQSMHEVEDLFWKAILRACENYANVHHVSDIDSVLSTDYSRSVLKVSMLSTVRQLLFDYLSSLFPKSQSVQEELLERIKNRIDFEYVQICKSLAVTKFRNKGPESKTISLSMELKDRVQIGSRESLWPQLGQAKERFLDLNSDGTAYGIIRNLWLIPHRFPQRLFELLNPDNDDTREISVYDLGMVFVDMMRWSAEDRAGDLVSGPFQFSDDPMPGLSFRYSSDPYLAIYQSDADKEETRAKTLSLIRGLLPFYLFALGIEDPRKAQILNQVDEEMKVEFQPMELQLRSNE